MLERRTWMRDCPSAVPLRLRPCSEDAPRAQRLHVPPPHHPRPGCVESGSTFTEPEGTGGGGPDDAGERPEVLARGSGSAVRCPAGALSRRDHTSLLAGRLGSVPVTAAGRRAQKVATSEPEMLCHTEKIAPGSAATGEK